jgi:hypothetical protein
LNRETIWIRKVDLYGSKMPEHNAIGHLNSTSLAFFIPLLSARLPVSLVPAASPILGLLA